MLAQVSQHPIRALKTLVLMPCFLATGMNLAIVGPTLLDLAQLTVKDITEVSYFLTLRSLGCAVGAVLMGLLSSRLNYMLALAVLFAVEFMSNLMAGLSGDYNILLSAFGLNGVCIGFVDGILNFIFLLLWGREAMPFMQLGYFMMGCGMIASPMLSKLFLSVPVTDIMEDGLEVVHMSETHVSRLYLLVALFQLLNALLVLGVWFAYPETTDHPSRATNEQQPLVTAVGRMAKSDSDKRVWRILVIVLHLICVHVYYGIEVAFGSYLTTFAVESELHLSKEQGTRLTTLFWSMFTLFKAVAILYIPFVGNACNILLGLAVMLAANGFLLPFGQSNVTLLWIGVAVIGAGLSSIYACMLRYLEDFVPISGVLGAMTCVSVVMGEFTFPVLISFFIESHPTVLLWAVLFSSLVMATLFPAIMLICLSRLSAGGSGCSSSSSSKS